MANIKVCSKCGKIGLDQYDFTVSWHKTNNKYYYNTPCRNCKARYRVDNRDKTKQYLIDNKDKISISAKKYYNEHFEHLAKWGKTYRKRNHKHYLDLYKKYKKNNKSKVISNNAKRRAMRLNQTPNLTENEKKKIELYYYISQCLGKEFHVDHIQPLTKGGLHHPDNLQITTKKYNLAKHNNENYREPETLEYFRI